MVDMTVVVRDGQEDPLAQTRRETQRVRRAWSVMALGSEASAQSLVALATGARSEMVRAQAAMTVLDRVGLGKIETHIVTTDLDAARMADLDHGTGSGVMSPVEILAARMRALASGGPVIAGAVVDTPSQNGDGDGEP